MLRPKIQPPTILKAEIVYWNDTKGFGFLHAAGHADDIFFHISNVIDNARPTRGEEVYITLQPSAEKGRLVAAKVARRKDKKRLARTNNIEHPYAIEGLIYCVIDILFFAVVTWFSLPLAITYLVLSVITILLYSYDKHAAIHHKFRIPESSLHIAALLGGWPGALIARPFLNHKTSKKRFILFFWLTVIINFCCLYFGIAYLHALT